MRIAIFTDSYLPGRDGVSMSVNNFSKLLAADGHQVMIFCPKKSRFYIEKKQKNIFIRRYSAIPAPSNRDSHLSLPFIWTVVKDLRAFKPDIVHVQTPLGIGLMGLWATKILKIKNIQTYHVYIPDFLAYLSPKALLGFDKVLKYISNSRSAKKIEMINQNIEKRADLFALNSQVNSIFKDVSKSDKKTDVKKMKNILAKRIAKFLYNQSDLVITPSHSMKKYLKAQGVKRKIQVVSNGIDNSVFKKKTNYKITNRIVHFGRLAFEKSVDIAIQAFYVAQQSKPELRLDIYGDGTARKSLQALVNRLGIANKVRFLGYYDIFKITNKIIEYDFFITASAIETQGIVLLEAMSSGLPVVAVDKLAVNEVVLSGKNGYLSSPNDAGRMAKNILKMASDEKKLEKFGKVSIDIAKTHEVSECKKVLYKQYQRVSGKD